MRNMHVWLINIKYVNQNSVVSSSSSECVYTYLYICINRIGHPAIFVWMKCKGHSSTLITEDINKDRNCNSWRIPCTTWMSYITTRCYTQNIGQGNSYSLDYSDKPGLDTIHKNWPGIKDAISVSCIGRNRLLQISLSYERLPIALYCVRRTNHFHDVLIGGSYLYIDNWINIFSVVRFWNPISLLNWCQKHSLTISYHKINLTPAIMEGCAFHWSIVSWLLNVESQLAII